MKPFGLTGNIGCGKSTVAALLREFSGVVIHNCDQIAKTIMDSGTYYRQMKAILGEKIFTEDARHGSRAMTKPNYDRLARVLFKKPDVKARLEALIHPLVWQEIARSIHPLPDDVITIVESAIIYEVGWEDRFDSIIVAACNPAEQIRRLRRNRKLSLKKISERMGQQMPAVVKEQKADLVIHTDCTVEELKQRVKELYHELKQRKEICQKKM